ncbi:fibronectin type III domain-containing protein [Aquimarina litoralis]|uniref:fibronectin type III domain-containing protein n=1 Tax=Aquimarina litoralis TaxID=584605 RepID=UPI001C5784D0|nr:fibronectin type III domain-containing protein [Aquimarina litoralis]MBW1296385.1 hypothetical protein [Aquimarina litoralis]
MKKIYTILLSSLMLFACSTEGIDDNGGLDNNAPSIPSLLFPTNNLICSNIDLEFEWDSSIDDQGDIISYQIEIALNAAFTNIVYSASTSQPTRSFNLEKGTTYFWRVKAMDNQQNESVYSEVRTFVTEPEAGFNTIPQIPAIVSPDLGSVTNDNIVALQWESNDADGDPLVYDVYFGETNPPALLAEDIDQNAFGVDVLPNKRYYWRVVAKDNQQGVAIGRVWYFETN